MNKKTGLSVLFASFLLIGLALLEPGRPFAQDQIEKPKIFDEYYQLITETDLYCSFYMLEEGKQMPEIRIIGAERMNEKKIFSDADIIYINRGAVHGLETGQLFQIIGLREKIVPYGYVTGRHARARIVRLEPEMATARIEKGCGPVRVGDYLLPFEEEEGEIGKDEGYGDLDPAAGLTGQVVYVEHDFHIAASNQWASISLGRQHCVQIGDQLNVFHQARPDLPREAIASAIIIDVRGATSTIKILGARDSVDIGNEVQINTTR